MNGRDFFQETINYIVKIFKAALHENIPTPAEVLAKVLEHYLQLFPAERELVEKLLALLNPKEYQGFLHHLVTQKKGVAFFEKGVAFFKDRQKDNFICFIRHLNKNAAQIIANNHLKSLFSGFFSFYLSESYYYSLLNDDLLEHIKDGNYWENHIGLQIDMMFYEVDSDDIHDQIFLLDRLREVGVWIPPKKHQKIRQTILNFLESVDKQEKLDLTDFELKKIAKHIRRLWKRTDIGEENGHKNEDLLNGILLLLSHPSDEIACFAQHLLMESKSWWLPGKFIDHFSDKVDILLINANRDIMIHGHEKIYQAAFCLMRMAEFVPARQYQDIINFFMPYLAHPESSLKIKVTELVCYFGLGDRADKSSSIIDALIKNLNTDNIIELGHTVKVLETYLHCSIPEDDEKIIKALFKMAVNQPSEPLSKNILILKSLCKIIYLLSPEQKDAIFEGVQALIMNMDEKMMEARDVLDLIYLYQPYLKISEQTDFFNHLDKLFRDSENNNFKVSVLRCQFAFIKRLPSNIRQQYLIRLKYVGFKNVDIDLRICAVNMLLSIHQSKKISNIENLFYSICKDKNDISTYRIFIIQKLHLFAGKLSIDRLISFMQGFKNMLIDEKERWEIKINIFFAYHHFLRFCLGSEHRSWLDLYAKEITDKFLEQAKNGSAQAIFFLGFIKKILPKDKIEEVFRVILENTIHKKSEVRAQSYYSLKSIISLVSYHHKLMALCFLNEALLRDAKHRDEALRAFIKVFTVCRLENTCNIFNLSQDKELKELPPEVIEKVMKHAYRM